MWAAENDGASQRPHRSIEHSRHAIAAFHPRNQRTGIVMTWIAGCTASAVALGSLALMSGGAPAQTAPDLSNGKIEFAYYPPKSVKFQATLERLKSRQVLEL